MDFDKLKQAVLQEAKVTVIGGALCTVAWYAIHLLGYDRNVTPLIVTGSILLLSKLYGDDENELSSSNGILHRILVLGIMFSTVTYFIGMDSFTKGPSTPKTPEQFPKNFQVFFCVLALSRIVNFSFNIVFRWENPM